MSRYLFKRGGRTVICKTLSDLYRTWDKEINDNSQPQVGIEISFTGGQAPALNIKQFFISGGHSPFFYAAMNGNVELVKAMSADYDIETKGNASLRLLTEKDDNINDFFFKNEALDLLAYNTNLTALIYHGARIPEMNLSHFRNKIGAKSKSNDMLFLAVNASEPNQALISSLVNRYDSIFEHDTSIDAVLRKAVASDWKEVVQTIYYRNLRRNMMLPNINLFGIPPCFLKKLFKIRLCQILLMTLLLPR